MCLFFFLSFLIICFSEWLVSSNNLFGLVSAFNLTNINNKAFTVQTVRAISPLSLCLVPHWIPPCSSQCNISSISLASSKSLSSSSSSPISPCPFIESSIIFRSSTSIKAEIASASCKLRTASTDESGM